MNVEYIVFRFQVLLFSILALKLSE